MLIAYAGLCACYMATTSPGAEFRPSNDAWIQVLVVIPGLALWFAGRWLMRRSSAAPPADPK
ncbi:hypothetical protein [Phenylobacterium sp.]|uniref:hypothetical protein n=1 Tax=Phenylobacterium sp. TaxID=1871053 RepID=UPI002C620463|nr:hypothetical protein [Phenylobacterium sp.]HLZ73709.1 hypothetical protein [Phenylobacterium sp.]